VAEGSPPVPSSGVLLTPPKRARGLEIFQHACASDRRKAGERSHLFLGPPDLAAATRPMASVILRVFLTELIGRDCFEVRHGSDASGVARRVDLDFR